MQEAQPAKVTKPSEIQTATIILQCFNRFQGVY